MSSFSGPYNEGAVTRGLVLYLDADELASYPGSGNTVTDLSPTGITASRDSNVVYSDNTNSLLFNNANNYLSISSNSAWELPGDFTIESWVYPTSTLTTAFGGVCVSFATNGIWFGNLPSGFGLRAFGVADLIFTTTRPLANTWTHVAVSRQSGVMRLFINGILTTTLNDSRTFVQGNLHIGSDGTTGAPWNGNISNLRLIKGVALYTSNFNPTRLQPIEGTSFLLAHNGFGDNGPNNFVPTIVGSGPSRSTLSPFSNNYKNFTLGGGSNNGITVGTNTALAFTNNFTLSATVKITAYQSSTFFGIANLIIDRGPATTYNYAVQISNATTVTFVKRTGTEGLQFFSFTVPTLTDRVVNIVFRYNNNILELYLNGSFVGNRTVTNIAPVAGDVFKIGGAIAPPNTPFTGQIYRVMVYNRALSQGEIAANYDSEAFKYSLPAISSTPTLVSNGLIYQLDASNESSYPRADSTWTALQGPVNASLINGPTYDVDGGGSIVFDGTDDYATIPYDNIFNFGSNPFTVCVWHKNTAASTNFNGIITADLAGDNTWKIFRDNGNNFYKARSGGSTCDFAPYTVNRWHYYVYTKSGTNLITYLDGVQSNSIPNSQNPASFSNALALGSYRLNNAQSLQLLTQQRFGAIQIYNRALSATEVLQNFEAQRTRFRV